MLASDLWSINYLLETDPTDHKTSECLKFLECSLQADEKMNTDTITSKMNNVFILKSRELLDHYKPLYEKAHSIYKISYDLGNSIQKMEQLYIDLKYRDQLILNKIKTYQLREGEIQNKRLVLEKLIQDSNLTQSNFELLINENTPLDLNFFEALESLDKLHSLQDSLNKLDLDKNGLKLSLEKNIVEIRHLALSKLVKHLNRNMDKIEIPLIIKSIFLLKGHKDLYSKFLKNYLKFRKTFNNELMDPVLNNYQMVYEKEYFSYFNEVFSVLLGLLKNEIAYLQGIFGEDFKKSEFIETIFEEVLFNIITKSEKLLYIETDFYTCFQVYSILLKYAKEIKTLLYEVSDEKSKIEKSNILISIKNLKKQAEVSLKKNLVTFGNKLLTMKFNIQNFTSYSLLIDFLNRVKTTFDFQLESEDFNKKGPNFSLELLVKPIIDLAQNKVSEYNKATQTLIFAVNLYNLVIGTFKNYESFNERNEKLMETLKNFTKLILENLYVEFSKKLAIENLKGFLENRKTEDENKKFKMILEFLIFFFKDHNYRMILKDTELFLDEAYRKSLQKQLINRFLDIYKEVLQDFMHFLEKNKIELDAENILLKETLNTVFEKNPLEDSIKIFTVEEMSNFLGILI